MSGTSGTQSGRFVGSLHESGFMIKQVITENEEFLKAEKVANEVKRGKQFYQ